MELKHSTTYKDRPVEVIAGWDPMLHRFWTIVEPLDDDNPDADEESGMIYSNLSDPDVPEDQVKASPDYFASKLKSLGIEVPSDFFAKVAAVNS